MVATATAAAAVTPTFDPTQADKGRAAFQSERGNSRRFNAMTVVFDWLESLQAAGDVARASHASPASLQARRSARLHRLLETAANDSPLYRRLMGRHGAQAPFEEWPAARKAELMAEFDHWVTDSRVRLADLRRFVADPARIADPYLGRYTVWESSGSHGEPAVFIQDAAALAVYDAIEAMRHAHPRPMHRWLDPWFGTESVAFIGATAGHFASTVNAERWRRLNPALRQVIHQVSFMQPHKELSRELERIAPTIVGTYPSVAVLLAEEKHSGRLDIRPREIWTGGETLTPTMRRFVGETFDCAVVDSYGASEFFTIACECAHGRLHLNSDWLILEPVDGAGRPVEPGVAGASVLLTNLANLVQPLIRYDLGDSVALEARPCACGSPLPVLRVQGRTDDTLRLGTSRSGGVPVLPLALSTVLEEGAGLFDFQLRQTGICRLSLTTPLRGAVAEAAMQRARAVLGEFLERQGSGPVDIQIATGRAHLAGPGGKVQRVVAFHPGEGPKPRKRGARAC